MDDEIARSLAAATLEVRGGEAGDETKARELIDRVADLGKNLRDDTGASHENRSGKV